jgi:hypothetical protein
VTEPPNPFAVERVTPFDLAPGAITSATGAVAEAGRKLAGEIESTLAEALSPTQPMSTRLKAIEAMSKAETRMARIAVEAARIRPADDIVRVEATIDEGNYSEGARALIAHVQALESAGVPIPPELAMKIAAVRMNVAAIEAGVMRDTDDGDAELVPDVEVVP